MEEEIEEQEEIFPGYTSIKDFTQDGFKVLVEATRNANALPQDRNYDFYNTHETFRNLMNEEGNSILRLINNIIKDQGVLGNFLSRDMEEKVELIVEANDAILERAAINLDEVNGIRKNPELPLEIQEVSAVLPVSGSWNKIDNLNCTVSSFNPENQPKKGANAIRLLTGNNIQRPQKFFKDRIDNSNNYPWEPRIKDKPNSLKPLAIFLEKDDDGTEAYSHPYDFELERFTPAPELLTPVQPVVPKKISETPLKMVEKEEELNEMLEDLRKYKELAIDLEHHSYRTFLGITCLMQISTVDTDYLVDTLSLRDKLCILNEVFTKPSIVKIFHGADHDIEWLQRDLSLYVVNMFDTHQATKQLVYEQRSLAYLLRKFCQIDANKHFQLADWRIRPLPDELKVYAREDTHYLIYIYHKLRNELLDLGNKKSHILKAVIDQSTELCKKRYKKPRLTANSHLDFYRKCKKLFDNRQMFALKELYKWRDGISRTEDESTGYVLPNHMLLQIAEILPREMQGILACCNPIPPLVRANLLEIHKLILKAREQSLVKPILSEQSRSLGSVQTVTRLNVDTALNCPHDLTYTGEFRDDLPTLLGNILNQNIEKTETPEKPIKKQMDVDLNIKIENDNPVINVFDSIEDSLRKLQKDALSKVKKMKFLGPFERYKMVKPFIQAMEEEKEKEKALLAKERKPERVVKGFEGDKISIEENNDKTDGKPAVERKVTQNGINISVEVINKPCVEDNANQVRVSKKDIPLRQMTGCKRKRSPSNLPEHDQTGNESDDQALNVEPLSDVRPSVAPEQTRNNFRKRKNKGGKNQLPKKFKDNQGNARPSGSFEDENSTQKRDNNWQNKKYNQNQNQHIPNQQNQNQYPNQNQRRRPNKKRQNNQQRSNQQNKGLNQPGSNQHNKELNQPGRNQHNKGNNQQRNNQQNKGNNQQGGSQQNKGNNQQGNSQQNKGNNQQGSSQQNKGNNQQGGSRRQNMNKEGNKKFNKGNTRNEGNAQAFDYATFDFKQFQGGAGSVNNAHNVKTNFKGKNKSKVRGRGIGQGNNRSSFFGMNKNPPRGKNR